MCNCVWLCAVVCGRVAVCSLCVVVWWCVLFGVSVSSCVRVYVWMCVVVCAYVCVCMCVMCVLRARLLLVCVVVCEGVLVCGGSWGVGWLECVCVCVCSTVGMRGCVLLCAIMRGCQSMCSFHVLCLVTALNVCVCWSCGCCVRC